MAVDVLGDSTERSGEAVQRPDGTTEMRRLTGLWRWGINVLPPAHIDDFYGWLALLDAAIDERTKRGVGEPVCGASPPTTAGQHSNSEANEQ